MNAFLHRFGWSDAVTTSIAGDASARRYARLSRGGKTAILMQDPEGDVALFARLARHLLSLGLSAPRILAEDPENGCLLIEDLGDGLLARLATDPETERDLYLRATDALIALHRHPSLPDLPVASPDRLAAMIDLAFVNYAGAPDALTAAQTAILPVLQDHAMPADVMILRDYHAENILDLPDRIGAARAGLLDFQDALTGHRAYDLTSLLRDARRDVGVATAEACITHYLRQTGLAEDGFRASLAVLAVQRNLRILGVFARLAANGKPNYLALLPRVWAHLQADLTHPALADLRGPLACLPPPDNDHIERLRQTCQTL